MSSLNLFFLCYANYENLERYLFLHRFFEKASIGQYWANLVENILFAYISLYFINSFLLYVFAYVYLYQIIQNMKHKLNLSNINEQKFVHFWKHRMTYFELRERCKKIFGFIAFFFFSSTFVVTTVFVLSLSLFSTTTFNLIVYFGFYAQFFAVPTFLGSFIIGDYVEYDHCFNVSLYVLLNEVNSSITDLNQMNDHKKRSFLNHLKLHIRVPVTVSNNSLIYFVIY